MAFICIDCIHPNSRSEFETRFSFSKGPCENCRYVDICVDTDAGIDPNWKTNVTKTLIAAGIPVPLGVRAVPKPPRDREVQ